MRKTRIVTRDELWIEFEKALKFGDLRGFKTRRGMNRAIDRLIKNLPGKEISFYFIAAPRKCIEYILPITSADIKRLR